MDNTTHIYYPPVGFYFSLSIKGETGPEKSAFQEVSGIEVGISALTDIEAEKTPLKLPTPPKYSNLVLKRGLIPRNSSLAKWCRACFNANPLIPVTTKSIILSLLHPDGTSAMTWTFINAWPVKWVISDVTSQDDIVIESIEFAYNYVAK